MDEEKKREILNFLREFYGELLDYELSFHPGYLEEMIIGAGFVCREEARETIKAIRKELLEKQLASALSDLTSVLR